MSDDASGSPAAALRAFVARAIDADLAALDGRVEVIERAGEPRDDGTDEGAPGGPTGSADPADRLAGLVAGTDSVVAVVPRFDADLARRLDASLATEGGDRAENGDAPDSDPKAPRTVRIAFTGAAGDRLGGLTGPAVRRILADRGVDAYRHDGDSPVAVVLAGDRAAVGAVDGDGIAALLWTDAPAVREWAAATCRRYLDAAEPVTEG